MPRRNRRQHGGKGNRQPSHRDSGARHGVAARRTTLVDSSGEWTVQVVSASESGRSFTCPGCEGAVSASTAHVVAWLEEGTHFSDEVGVDYRRHWHTRCWQARVRRER